MPFMMYVAKHRRHKSFSMKKRTNARYTDPITEITDVKSKIFTAQLE
jgi:hypothetical protein